MEKVRNCKRTEDGEKRQKTRKTRKARKSWKTAEEAEGGRRERKTAVVEVILSSLPKTNSLLPQSNFTNWCETTTATTATTERKTMVSCYLKDRW